MTFSHHRILVAALIAIGATLPTGALALCGALWPIPSPGGRIVPLQYQQGSA